MSKSFSRTLLLALVFGIAIAVIGLMLGGSTSVYFDRGSWRPQVNRHNKAEIKGYDLDAFKHIELDTGNMDVAISVGDSYQITLDEQSARYDLSGDTLTVKGLDSEGRSYMGIMAFGAHFPVTITVPKDAALGRLDMTGSAGQIRLTDIVAEDVDIETRAGGAVLRHVKINKLDAQAYAGSVTIETGDIDEAHIETRAGDVQLSDATINQKLDVNTRAGSVRAYGRFMGNTTIETSMGGIDFATDLKDSEYKVSVDSTLGDQKVYDKGNRRDDAPNKLTIKTRMGDVSVRFAE